MKKFTLTFLLFNLAISISYAQSGSLDSTFGTSGVVSTGFGGMYETAESVTIQSDGKIVVVGSSGMEVPRIGVIAIARYNSSNGSIDNTFGSGGIVNTRFNDANFYYGHSVAMQSDGKIVVAGHRGDTTTNTIYSFVVARYNSDGSLNNVWGNLPGRAHSVALQSDGKTVVAGTSGSGIGLMRFNTNDSYDTTFGSNGIVTTTVGSGNCGGNSVVIQGDGKIVVAGGNGDFVLVRYKSNGSLDSTFGSGGIVTTDFGSSSDYGMSTTIQIDGKIVVAGISNNGTNAVVALARYNTNGSLDNTFGTGGKVTTSSGSEGLVGNSVAIQNDGKIVVAGRKDTSSPGLPGSSFAVVKYNSNGSLDNTFGTGGIASTHVYVGDEGLSTAIQNDGKIVVAGYSVYTNGPFWHVIRFNNNTVVSGISEYGSNNELDVNIYPNPSSGIFTINLKNQTVKTEICIHDILGNCVLDKMSVKNNNQGIDLSHQPKGVYFVEISSGDERTIKKIVLE